VKRDLHTFLTDVAFGAGIALLLLLVMAAAYAEEPATAELRADCGRQTCVVVQDDLRALLQSNDANYDRAVKVEAELEKLRKLKGCAKVEVTEPPKGFVPKKERDS
jgi:hypothetical protein